MLMGAMIECQFCNALLPGDSLYCYQCGNTVANNPNNTLEVDSSEALSEEDIPTSISTQNASTEPGQLHDDPVVIDAYATVLDTNDDNATVFDMSNEDVPPPGIPSEEQPAEPITGEVEVLADYHSGEALIPEEDDSSADADSNVEANETLLAEPEPAYADAEPVALDDLSTVENPLPLYP